MDEDETYSAPEAAKVLRLSKRRIQQMLQAGELSGTKQDDGRWTIPKHAVHARKDETKSKRRKRPATASQEGRIPTDLMNELRAAEREIGRLEGRLELTTLAETTLREQLERERMRADNAESKAAELEAELAQARRRPWWKKMFGG